MTKKEILTLEDALRYECDKCTETIKKAWENVKIVHPERTPAEQFILLHASLCNTFMGNPAFMFCLMNAVLGKFLVPELTPEEHYSIRMYDMRRKDDE